MAALRAGKLRVRQRPGPKNALGAIKFGLPNTMRNRTVQLKASMPVVMF
jgi:hypothetical protein